MNYIDEYVCIIPQKYRNLNLIQLLHLDPYIGNF